MNRLAVLIPAAGAARRMGGGDKLTEDVGGEPALRRAARLASELGAQVIVTLPAASERLSARRAALAGLQVRCLEIADWREGMAASLRAGAAAAEGAQGLMVLLPDMPGIEPADLAALFAAFLAAPDRPLRATTPDGAPGHPVILPARLLPAMETLTGDRGAAGLLATEAARLVVLAGDRAIRDLDTPEDWARWRATRG
ncbi:MAG: NTP transferase domain-containing protein [Defluviimonas sp.]|uniref:nucleotidyltransferase family protein n=1 Tax=Albidovulum sp. TaxID=1872424 RepID=UPI001DA919BB|nr:NTP transferase domain-containing protein [Paracoccaceae bacterium]MCC0065038.1 NTP transferase domain-containing protein [Defluviimonas sp.]